MNEKLKRLREKIASHNCDALLIEHSIDLLYLTGMHLSAGKLIISPHDSCLIVDGRYYETCCLQNVYTVRLLSETALQEWLKSNAIQTLGFDTHHTTYHRFVLLQDMAKNLNADLIPLDAPIEKMRMLKGQKEIEYLRKAARLGFEGYEYVVSLLKEGISEAELAFELEFFWKKKGASGLAFDPIIAFGANSSMPHYRAGPTKLKNNTSVLIDIGVILDNYNSDMTRVVFFGEVASVMQSIYQIVDEAKSKALELCRPGTLIGDLDKAAREWITSKGYGENFTHSLGHGVGLDIHEAPTIRATGAYTNVPLQAGMVITIEPGIYLPKIGGVRLEDTILITEIGYENLTE